MTEKLFKEQTIKFLIIYFEKMKTMHISMSIEWLERELNKKHIIQREKYCIDAFWLSYQDVLQWIAEYKEKWYKFIPGGWCDNIKSDGSCWGHKNL